MNHTIQVTEIQTFVQTNPQLGFSVILQLTGAHGSQQFDKLTKTKTVESILTSMDIKGIQSYIDHLLQQVNQFEGIDMCVSLLLFKSFIMTWNSSDFKAINSRRSWIIDQLVILIRNSAVPRNGDWVQMILDWFVAHGLFVIKKKSDKSPFRAVSRM